MIKEIDVNELKSKIDSGEKFFFIDCREQNEWDEMHVAGSTLLPLSEFQEKYEEVLTDKNASVAILCRSGKRSMNACMFLLSKGYTDLNNVEGGILAWQGSGFAVK